MEEELANLKKMLRSLVLSSPTRIDARSVLRDYRNLVGEPLPHLKFGYSDPLVFLRERFNDCFLFQGPSSNPELTLIVPNVLKHLDNFVQKQRMPSTAKNIHKRRSIPESTVKPRENQTVTTFEPQHTTQAGTTATEKTTMNRQITQHDYKPQATSKPPQQCEDHHVADAMDSDRLTPPSRSSNIKKLALEELKREVRQLVLESPEGLLCTDLIRLYRQRHGHELEFGCFGFTSVLSLASCVAGVTLTARPDCGDWLLSDAARVPAPAPAPAPAPVPSTSRAARAPARSICRTRNRAALVAESEDALPGIDYAPEVFPEDCLHMLESIPAASVADVRVGDTLEVVVSEVYSPSHFWLQLLGERHNIAMENIMDQMNQYYSHGEGRTRRLLPGAVRVGYYCTSCYEGDWHRSLIIKIINEDTVKVRYVDYGTVERVPVSGLRPLRREWAALDAQALRARLAGVRPPRTAGRLWPRTSAYHFLELVRDRRLVAPVVAVDAQEDVLEVLLIDTSTSEDRCIGSELVLAEHAEARDDSVSGTSVGYLLPRFAALESGATPSFAEIGTYIRDGILLDCVEGYRVHVLGARPRVAYFAQRPSSPPSTSSPPPSTSSPPSPPRSTLSPAESVHVHFETPPAPYQRVPLATPPATRELEPFVTPPALRKPKPVGTLLEAREQEPLVTPPAARELAPVVTPPALRKPKPVGTSLAAREPESLVTQHAACEQAPLATSPTDAPATCERAPPARCLAAYNHSPLVTLSRRQVHVYCLLSQLAPSAANRFMLQTLQRALEEADDAVSATCVSSSNPHAVECAASPPPLPPLTPPRSDRLQSLLAAALRVHNRK